MSRRVLAVLLSVAVASVAWLLPVAPVAEAATAPQFIQSRTNEIKSGTTNSLAFSGANTAGNLIVVYAVWGNNGAVTVSDTRGNSYASAMSRTTWGTGRSLQVFYARDISGGSNTVTATFATPIT